MKRPICSICGNKINDNTYIWIDSERTLVHKVCRMVTNEYKKNITVKVSPLKMGTKMRR